MDKGDMGERILKDRYPNLADSPEVSAAVKGYKNRNRVNINYQPTDRIAIYIRRLDEIVHDEDSTRRERALEILKKDLYRHTIIKPEKIPNSYWVSQIKVFQRQNEYITWEDFKKQRTEKIVEAQKETLGSWFDVLSSSNSPYPTWLRYWAFRSIIGMGAYDDTRHIFTKREESTINPFPELNEEALSQVMDKVDQKYNQGILDKPNVATNFLLSENFSKLYASAIEKLKPTSSDNLIDTRGGWAVFTANSDPMKDGANIIIDGDHQYKGKALVPSIIDQGTGWCITTAITAKAELANGELHLFYSLDRNGEPTIPRIAIRTVRGKIIEVSGLSKYQNIDPYILDVVEKKLLSFGEEGKKFGEKKINDIRVLNTIDTKRKNGEPLTESEIAFLRRETIQGFGTRMDPRFQELKEFYISN